MRGLPGGSHKSVTHSSRNRLTDPAYSRTVSDGLTPRKQAFLDMLSGRTEAAPAVPPPAAEGDDPSGAPEPATGAPLTFEQQPPAAGEIPAALGALADETVHVPATESWEDKPLAAADLMDLGADAQAQGFAMALQTVASRLASIVHDLGALEYFDQASALVPTMEWAVGEHNRIMGELEQRGEQRRGEG
jgi:hypothetical protein